MSSAAFFAGVGALVLVLGVVRVAQARDWIVRLIALNVAGGGALVVLVALSRHGDVSDPVPHALALTGIVIMVAVTGVGLVLARLVAAQDAAGGDEGNGTTDAAGPAAAIDTEAGNLR